MALIDVTETFIREDNLLVLVPDNIQKVTEREQNHNNKNLCNILK